MENYYEINVSKDGQHLFATAPRSIKSRTELKKLYVLFKVKFPESQGYALSVRHVEYTITGIDLEVVQLENE